jgi:hypothetical protein
MIFLYIDPGTGSALFSVLIGAAATLYFLGRALLIKLKVLFLRDARKSTANPIVIYSEGVQYWNLFKPVLEALEEEKAEALFLTSARNDPVFNESYHYIKREFIGEGNRAYSRLNMMQADVCLMTTPGLDVYQLKRSRLVKRYIHLLHGFSDAAMYRLFGIDYYDAVLLTGDYQKDGIRTLEELRNTTKKELVAVGCTYLDDAAKRLGILSRSRESAGKLNRTADDAGFTVLVSPSWGPSSLLTRFGEHLLDPLASSPWNIIVRPHPQTRRLEESLVSRLEERYRGKSNIRWDYERDNLHSLSQADIMISDFSSIIFDYVFLFDKPVIYVRTGMDLRPYDADDLGDDAIDKLWQFRTLQKIGRDLKESDLDNIEALVKSVSDSAELRNARKAAREEAWFHPGQSGKLTARYLLETCKKQDLP